MPFFFFHYPHGIDPQTSHAPRYSHRHHDRHRLHGHKTWGEKKGTIHAVSSRPRVPNTNDRRMPRKGWRRSTARAPATFGLTKPPDLKPAPGRASLEYDCICHPTSSFDIPLQTRKYLGIYIFIASFLVSSSHETRVEEYCWFCGGGGVLNLCMAVVV